MNKSMKVAEAVLRAEIYTILSQCFFQPTEDLAVSIADGSLVEFFQSIEGIEEDRNLKEAIAAIERFGMGYQEKPHAQLWQDLKIEYNRLFVGPGHLEAPPYESIYQTKDEENPEGLLMGDSTVAVKHFYRSAGIELSDDFTDLPDHIAVELGFMAHLCTLAAEHKEDVEKGISICNMQRQFLKEHLGSWITEFSHTVGQATKSDFYRGIASLAAAWIQLDWNALNH